MRNIKAIKPTDAEIEALIEKHGQYDSAEDALNHLVIFMHRQLNSIIATMEVAADKIDQGRFGEPTEDDKLRIVRLRALLSAFTQSNRQN